MISFDADNTVLKITLPQLDLNTTTYIIDRVSDDCVCYRTRSPDATSKYPSMMSKESMESCLENEKKMLQEHLKAIEYFETVKKRIEKQGDPNA